MLKTMGKLTLILLITLVMVIPAAAQQPTFGLSPEDFGELASANASSVAITNFDFTYDVTLTLDGMGVPVDVVLSGTGSINEAEEMIGITVEGTADVMGQTTPLEGEFRVLSETIYVRGTNPTTGEDTGWFSLAGDDLDSIDPGEIVSPDSIMETANLSDAALIELLGALDQVDPNSFLFMSRDGDTFTAELSLFDLLSTPGLTEALNSAIEDGGDDYTLSAEAFAETFITLDQTVDTANGLISNSVFSIISTLNPADFGESGSPASVIFILDVSVSNYNASTVVAAPESAVEIPSTLVAGVLEDAGLAGGSSMDMDAVEVATGEAQSIELTCETRAFDFDGGTGTVYTGICPSDCTAGIIWGTGQYTDDSAICTAAIHAGAIAAEGGSITMVIQDGMDAYPASEQNGISSSEWGSWGRTFAFQTAVSSAAPVQFTCESRGFDFEGDAGASFVGTCPSDCTSGVLWGTNAYTDDSAICTAAIHAGVISAAGGEVTMTIDEGMDAYPASEQNGISSSEWGSWGRTIRFDGGAMEMSGAMEETSSAAGSSGEFAVTADLPNSYTFPNGISFSFPDGYAIDTESEVVTMVTTPNNRAYIQAYETNVLFGEMDMGLEFMMETYGNSAATTWSFPFETGDYVETEVNGRTLQVLEFEGTQGGEPVVGSVVIAPYTSGGYGYTIAYALDPVPANFLADALAVAASLDN